jgi:hypothetical protein
MIVRLPRKDILIRNLTDYTLVFMLILTGGASVFMSLGDNILIVFLLISSAFVFITRSRVNVYFILYAVAFLVFLLALSFMTDGSLGIKSVIGTVLKLVFAYTVLVVVRERTIDTFIRVVAFLAFASLLGYSFDILGWGGKIDQITPRVFDLIYKFGRPLHLDRNNSIFFEPSAYQIFLNAALFMLAFANTRLTPRKIKAYTFILVLALITSQSTTGYLIYSVILVLTLLRSRNYSKSLKMTVSGALVLVALFAPVIFQSVIQEKFEAFFAIQDITDNEDRRSFDTVVDWSIFKENMLGWGYEEYRRRFSERGLIAASASSSNGITRTLAVYGLPFSVFLFGSFCLFFVKYLKDPVVVCGGIIILVLFLFAQSYFVLQPVMLALPAAMFLMMKRQKTDPGPELVKHGYFGQ